MSGYETVSAELQVIESRTRSHVMDRNLNPANPDLSKSLA